VFKKQFTGHFFPYVHISQLLIFTPYTIGFDIFRGHTCGNLDYTVSSRYIIMVGSAII